MARLELPYVQAVKDKHGTIRHYYRRNGYPRLKLPGGVGSAEFMAAYAEAHGRKADINSLKIVRPKSIDALFIQYYQSSMFLALKDATKKNYRNILERFRAKCGHVSALTLQTPQLEAIFLSMGDRPGAARNLRRRLHTVFGLAVRLGWRADNPVAHTSSIKSKSSGFTAWSDEDIRKFEARWPSGSRERLAFALLLYTGVRRSDVVTLGRQHIQDNRISVTQLKTNKRVNVLIHPALLKELGQADGMTFITTKYGVPFSAAGFTKWFKERAEMAGLKGLTPHGLRKAAARRLAEAGCSANEIAAVLGHSTLAEVELYTRAASQMKLADSAIHRLR